MSIGSALDYGIRIGKGFGVFQRIKEEIVKQPDVALKHLVRVLDVVEETFEAFCKVLNDYLSLWFDPSTLASDANLMIVIKTRLRRMKGGYIGRELQDARFHCSQIGDIYDRWLSPYFGKLYGRLSDDYSEAQTEIENLFLDLAGGDESLIQSIEEMERGLQDSATEILGHLRDGKYHDAMQKIENDEILWDNQEAELSEIIKNLGSLKTDLRDLTGAIV